ncbi:MAG: radical SAM protein [bacterium]
MKIMFAAMGSEIISMEAISALLKQYEHQCELAFDRGLFDDKQYFSVPFLAKIFSDKKQVIRDIVLYKPDLLAFSVFADNFQWCLEIASEVKKHFDVPVIMGGIHPTSVPDVCIAEDPVDIICLGEGEYPVLELAESMHKGKMDYSIKNLWFKKNDEIIKNPCRKLIANLDELPIIDKKLFEPFIPISKYYLTVTNKGCIARCSYCSQNYYARWEQENNLGAFYRERSVNSVIEELKIMKAQYHVKRVDIKNNVLAGSRRWTLEFLEKYKKEIDVPFRIMGHPKTITPEMARALKDAGCWHVQIGVESLDPDMRRDVLNRHESNEDIYQALHAMDEVGLKYSVDVMVGLPGEKDEHIIRAIEVFAGLKHLIRASIFWLQYLPNVEITYYARNHNFIDDDDLYKINRGLQANYLSTGSVGDKMRKEKLLNFQMLFRLLPVLPESAIRFFLKNKRYKIFRCMPQIPVIIAVDILVSVVRRDHWAVYAMYSYLFEIMRRIKRIFKPRVFQRTIKNES